MHFHNSTTFEAMCCRYILNNVRTEPSLLTLPSPQKRSRLDNNSALWWPAGGVTGL